MNDRDKTADKIAYNLNRLWWPSGLMYDIIALNCYIDPAKETKTEETRKKGKMITIKK